MSVADRHYADIKAIHIAHEYVLDRVHKCEYPQGRGSYGLICALKGRAEYRFRSGERVIVEDDDILFLSPDTAYSIVTDKEFAHYTVNFDIHTDTSDTGLSATSYALVRKNNNAQITQAFKRLTDVWQQKRAGYEMQAIGHLYILLALFFSEYTNQQGKAFFQRLLPAREYIEQHFDKPVTLERLSFLASMSVTNFRREWRKCYVQTPMQYRDEVRLYYAKEYLLSGYYTVSEVSEKCGFEDVSYFVRFFKKKTGIPPGKFQKQPL